MRVYTEERDRPVIAVVDQRLPMFFGSQKKMKSVIAAEVAAITAWRVLSVGDRIGAILFNDTDTIEARPTRNEKKVMGWLGDLTDMNNDLSVERGHSSNPDGLANALKVLERSIGHDYLIVLISDFYGWNDQTLDAIRRIRRHNDVISALVFDPLERDISRADKLVVSDGRFQLELEPGSQGLGEKFEASFNSSLARVQADLKRHRIPILPIDTLSPSADQLREQLGGERVLQ